MTLWMLNAPVPNAGQSAQPHRLVRERQKKLHQPDHCKGIELAIVQEFLFELPLSFFSRVRIDYLKIGPLSCLPIRDVFESSLIKIEATVGKTDFIDHEPFISGW